ncbi:restriction endonuclease [Salinivibrio sp. PR5]|uniref:restriction endonuclease subunit S n=1 Tax=Salinivibrio sp. PR5 TaxID=1909484 RepID=UPI00098B64C2|nr:restriction endonuclease subunit S [Salinivibrio sp. PR5]OOF11732.1 restriction endonuclease [Salinivibrio sp. PR5]
MSIEKKVPDIRFNGFNDEWQEKKLGDIGEIKTGPFGSSLHAEAYVTDGHAIITTEHFKLGKLPVDKDGIPQVCDDDYSRLKSYLLKSGDIVFSRVGSVDINAHVTDKQEGWLFSGRVLRVRSDESIDSEYLHQELSTSRVKKSVVSRAVGQTMPSINTEILKTTPIYTPTDKTEQKKIGVGLKKIDILINQHRQKHEKLIQLKDAMLEKMFPKAGERVPEIRFGGFSGEWEEERLGDVVSCFSGGTPAVGVEEYYKGSIPFIRSSEINKASTELKISESGINNSSAKVVEVGTVLYALYGATSGEVGRAKLRGAINQAILAIIPATKLCPEFLSQWLRKCKSSIVNTYLQGGQGNLSGDIVKNLVLISPTFEEQKSIGNYFQKLDALINQHQQQITKLNTIKQACLDKMFV